MNALIPLGCLVVGILLIAAGIDSVSRPNRKIALGFMLVFIGVGLCIAFLLLIGVT